MMTYHALCILSILSVLCVIVSGIPSGGKYQGAFFYQPSNNIGHQTKVSFNNYCKHLRAQFIRPLGTLHGDG